MPPAICAAATAAIRHLKCSQRERDHHQDRAARLRSGGIALLEERPFLDEAVSHVQGPAIVVGMFSGEGMHGACDAPRLVAELNRDDVIYAGVIGNIVGIEDLVTTAVGDAVRRPAS